MPCSLLCRNVLFELRSFLSFFRRGTVTLTSKDLTTHNDIHNLFQRRGNSEYGGEAVTQLEHALQAADLAEREQAAPDLIVAALLHDIGHLLHALPADTPAQGVDDHHENSAGYFLKQFFPESVVAPVRMHVAAKRYLCATDPDYMETLSPPSQLSLRLQGGPMSDDEVHEFETQPFAQEAVRLRRWDDAAKIAGLPTPSLEHFLGYVEKVALSTEDTDATI
jgi:[1-hydroxy-2-(trimethylamino)ethyl]phosphonate dioxygenase